MEIKNLSTTGLNTIVDCLLEAFAGYFVKMPADPGYWRERFKGARADFHLSFGVFDNGKLVAFIINGIDRHNGHLTAFNTGTGVLPDYRGQKLVDRLYDFAIPLLREAGVTRCALEVIEDNSRGIRVYERIGFNKMRRLRCFKGMLEAPRENYRLKQKSFREIMSSAFNDEEMYSWDHSASAILASGNVYDTYVLQNDSEQELGYFTINSRAGYLARIEQSGAGGYDDLLSAVASISREIKINNVDEKRKNLLVHLERAGLTNFISQFEMEFYV